MCPSRTLNFTNCLQFHRLPLYSLPNPMHEKVLNSIFSFLMHISHRHARPKEDRVYQHIGSCSAIQNIHQNDMVAELHIQSTVLQNLKLLVCLEESKTSVARWLVLDQILWIREGAICEIQKRRAVCAIRLA